MGGRICRCFSSAAWRQQVECFYRVYSLVFYFHAAIFQVWVDFTQGACTQSLDSQAQGAPTRPPHPWSLWLVNHFPHPLLVVLWLWVTALIWLGWPTGKFLWLCTTFWLETLIKVTKSSLSTPLVLTQNKRVTHPRLGLGLGSLLTPSKTANPLFFSGYTGLNTGEARVQAN